MSGRLLVLYDPACAFCRASAGWIGRLDCRHHLNVEGIHGDRRLDGGRVLSRAEQETALHVVEPGGRVLVGFFACRRLAWALPALWWMVPFLYLPGIPWLGVRAYAWIAGHRGMLARLLRVRGE